MKRFAVIAIVVIDTALGRSAGEVVVALILIVVLVAAAPSRPPVEWEEA